MRLSELLKKTGYSTEATIVDVEITEIVTDSSRVTYNSMFICLVGSIGDGHRHITEALLKGAACIVVQRGVQSDMPFFSRKRANVVECDNTRLAAARLYSVWYGEPAKRLKLIAVTGTNGKTSVTVMLKSIFEAAFYKCGIIGTVACYSGKRRLLDSPDRPLSNMTTPDPKQLYRMLAFMAADKVDYVFIEASSHALKLFKLDAISFECGIFLNLGRDHLDFHKTAEDYLLSKLRLFELCKRGLINADSERSPEIWERANRYCQCKSFSSGGRAADFRADDIENCGVGGICYTLRSKNTVMKVKSPIPGDFTVENTLCAASCALMMGVPPQTVRYALESLCGVEGRVERLKTDENIDFSVFIDYAHTPEALERLLQSFKTMKRDGRLVLLFGCGGDRDRVKRSEMGRIASILADRCVITADNSRGERTADIMSDIMSGIDECNRCKCEMIEDRRRAIEKTIGEARHGDLIILAGKGHEKYEIDSAGRHEFDEKNIALGAIRKYHGNN